MTKFHLAVSLLLWPSFSEWSWVAGRWDSATCHLLKVATWLNFNLLSSPPPHSLDSFPVFSFSIVLITISDSIFCTYLSCLWSLSAIGMYAPWRQGSLSGSFTAASLACRPVYGTWEGLSNIWIGMGMRVRTGKYVLSTGMVSLWVVVFKILFI